MIGVIKDFRKLESASGIVLLVASALALVFANSPLAESYQLMLAPFSFAINDGLMAVFFLLVGLEIKREILEGELSTRASAALPLVAALGGIATPAIIYSMFNWGSYEMRGWAIPSATDIAFSLGVLALAGSRVPASLKIFLMAVAVIDDLAAVIIIALFYTEQLAPQGLMMSLGCLIVLWGLNRCVTRLWPYLLAGAALWFSLWQASVHPTIAGVLLGAMIPLPLARNLIHRLHPWVAFGIMPVFAFANAGVSLSGVSAVQLLQPLPLGIALGLFIGKQLGIFIPSLLWVRVTRTALPAASWLQFYSVCMIAGIGFTMSLFIGTLAFPENDAQHYVRLGVIIGSLLSAIFGYILLTFALGKGTVRSA
jgi:Na+:H+ antiporter, NhaA family